MLKNRTLIGIILIVAAIEHSDWNHIHGDSIYYL